VKEGELKGYLERSADMVEVLRIGVLVFLFHRLSYVSLVSSPSSAAFLQVSPIHIANPLVQALELHTSSNARPPPHNKLHKCLHNILGALSLRRVRRSKALVACLDFYRQCMSPLPPPQTS
jgi:hypothetical protein